MNTTLTTSGSGSADRDLREEVRQLAAFIEQAKAELFAIGASGGGGVTGDAAQHLDAVIKGTEEASHAIMDAVDVVQNTANGLSGAPQEAIMGAVTKIYEACTFQDLTGQRVNKVIKILKEVDARIGRMLQLFGGDAAVTAIPRRDERAGDERLLNGPQLPDQAPSQDDVDALFANSKP